MAADKKIITYKKILVSKFINRESNSFLDDFIYGRKHFFCFAGRTGMLTAIDMLHIKPGEKVLLPAYAPEGLILPFRKRKITRKYYSLKENMDPDITEIRQIIEQSDIKLIIVIHYFGRENNINEVLKLSSQNNIPVLEDCAQAFLSMDEEGNYLGKKGDIALISFPKFLPVPDGSLFLINNSSISSPDHSSFNRGPLIWIAWLSGLLSMKINTVQVYYLPFKIFHVLSSFFYLIYYSIICSVNRNYKISSYSLNKLKRFAYEEIMETRKKNMETYHTFLKIPQAYNNAPGYIVTSKSRDKLQKNLKKKRIETLVYKKRWYYLEKPINSIETIYNHEISEHLLLPISEYLQSKDVKRVIAAITGTE